MSLGELVANPSLPMAVRTIPLLDHRERPTGVSPHPTAPHSTQGCQRALSPCHCPFAVHRHLSLLLRPARHGRGWPCPHRAGTGGTGGTRGGPRREERGFPGTAPAGAVTPGGDVPSRPPRHGHPAGAGQGHQGPAAAGQGHQTRGEGADREAELPHPQPDREQPLLQ